MSPTGDRGSATIWIVVAIGLVVAATSVAIGLGGALLARRHAADAADEAALAVAAHALAGPAACGYGAAIAGRDGARMGRCELADAIATVEVTVRLPGALARFGTADGRARAGPVSVG